MGKHYRYISNLLNRNGKAFHRYEFFYIMKCVESIDKAHDALNREFSFTLMKTTALLVSVSSNYSRHIIILSITCWVDNKTWSFFLWDLFDSTDFFLRIVLFCYAADRAHSAGIIFIYS